MKGTALADHEWNENDCVRDQDGRFADKPGSKAAPVTGDTNIPYADGDFDAGQYMNNGPRGFGADADDMAGFRNAMTARPIAMGDREYGEAATVENGRLRLYSGLHPRIPLMEIEIEDGGDPHAMARAELGRDKSVLQRFASDCAGRRIRDVLPDATQVDDDTVRVPTSDGGNAEIWFDGDTAKVQWYDADGRRGLDEWAELADDETVSDYMRRIADMVG